MYTICSDGIKTCTVGPKIKVIISLSGEKMALEKIPYLRLKSFEREIGSNHCKNQVLNIKMCFSFILSSVLKLFHTKFTKTIILVGPLSLWSSHLPGSAGGSGNWTGCQGSRFSSLPTGLLLTGAAAPVVSEDPQVRHHPSCPQGDGEVGRVQPDPSHGAHTGREQWAQVPAAGRQHPCS